MEENLYEFDYMIINVESCLNGSLKMIDCGVGAFRSIESASNGDIKVGTIISTRVAFNKKFDNAPIVVVSWRAYNSNEYWEGLATDDRYVDSSGFGAIATTKALYTCRYTWVFSWIAISR